MKIHEEGFRIAMQKELQLNREQAENFYNDHRGQPYFDELISRMTMYANRMLMFYHVLYRTPSRRHYASVVVGFSQRQMKEVSIDTTPSKCMAPP